jgi:hypothetical protein
MNPLVCLDIVQFFIEDGEFDEAQNVLISYWNWRQAGNDEPEMGDVMAQVMQQVIDLNTNEVN